MSLLYKKGRQKIFSGVKWKVNFFKFLTRGPPRFSTPILQISLYPEISPDIPPDIPYVGGDNCHESNFYLSNALLSSIPTLI